MVAGFTITATAVPWIALCVAIATFLAGQREVRRRAKLDYVNQLEERNKTCLSECVELRKQVSTLKDQNFELMTRMANVERR